MANRAWIVASRVWWSDSPRLLISGNARNEPQRADQEVGQAAPAARALIDTTKRSSRSWQRRYRAELANANDPLTHHNRT